MSSLSFDTTSFFVQGLASGLSKRLSEENDNSLLLNIAPTGRQAKRIAQQINYSEDYIDDFDFEDTPSANLTNKGSITNQTQANVQKFSPARNTPYMKELDDEQKISELVGKPQILIPIKIALENSNSTHKLVDFFMWNLNESLITPYQFAEIVCNDLELPNAMISQIADSINQQIEEYNFASNLQLPTNNPCNVIIDLAVNLNKQLYQDRFEWDLNQNEVTPEQFAQIVVADVGLSLEFKPAISHALHEIIIRVKKEIIEGTFNNEIHNLHLVRGIIFENGIRIFTETSIQNGNDHWEPLVEVLTSSEIERRENERIRNLRRLKRENMKRDYDDYSGAKRRQVGRRRFDELEGSWKGV
ncbi:chromatin structure remodeling complex protein SFH1 [Spathaspora passalidarum NRRL Y-27907]|uniref:Chromatin structure remodeling complex protein SFH1 n=1 Tax=Spathaspora passalidarum (strain NRRL Y-27907 / 11-Y1) TaxID=619300 RepID=G3ATM0_SPAPN|nr:chromatin structure remodeling complex protein SFH1 [Spathaspora passalidarum NRRL Y-27907]EGW30983.1 chromatin structure remodeling complex protein SFH1 [Spathaspora passalidarum NRRL Y-27907]